METQHYFYNFYKSKMILKLKAFKIFIWYLAN